MPIDPEEGISDFYSGKDTYFAEATERASFVWRFNVLGSKKIRVDIAGLNTTTDDFTITRSIAHGDPGDNTYTTLKTDRGLTLYRRINARHEAKWVIVSDPLSNGARVLAEVEPAHRGTPDEAWYTELTRAFEGTVTLTVPGEDLSQPAAAIATAEPQPEVTAEPVATDPPKDLPDVQAGPADYVGTWYSTWLSTGGMTGDPRSTFGLTLILTLM